MVENQGFINFKNSFHMSQTKHELYHIEKDSEREREMTETDRQTCRDRETEPELYYN